MPDGSSYDVALTVFNPEGRLLQLEYANRVIDRAYPTVGLKYRGGSLLTAVKRVDSKLMDVDKLHKIYKVSDDLFFAYAGMSSDARVILERLRENYEAYVLTYGESPSLLEVAKRISDFIPLYTLFAAIRPFGVASLLAGVGKEGDDLILVLPSGIYSVYKAIALGMNSSGMNKVLEERYKEDLELEDAIRLSIDVVRNGVDPSKVSVDTLEIAYVNRNERKGYLLSKGEISKFLSS